MLWGSYVFLHKTREMNLCRTLTFRGESVKALTERVKNTILQLLENVSTEWDVIEK